jgi:membrane-bound lytic murein transglycosylase B
VEWPTILAASLLLFAAACEEAGPVPVAVPSPETSPAGPASPATSPSSRSERDINASPERAIHDLPERAAALASVLVSLDHRLRADVEDWVAAGADPSSSLAHRVEIQTLRYQIVHRALAADSALANRVVSHLPDRLAPRIRRLVSVAARVRSLVTPIEPPVRLKTTKPLPARTLRRVLQRAAARYEIDWEILAAVNFVETRFGRVLGPSSSGARGPMQFLPATWEQYGAGGDILDPRDAIPAAARMLAANGGMTRIEEALHAYNNSEAYVDAILTYAREMRRDERFFYVYYYWQVFVITTKGDVQLTGVGRNRPPELPRD